MVMRKGGLCRMFAMFLGMYLKEKGRLKYFSDGLCLNSVYCQTESA
jgi:hypothetical protein